MIRDSATTMIGIFVPAGPDQARQLEQMLRNAGAAEVRHEAA